MTDIFRCRPETASVVFKESLVLRFITWDERMEGALDRFGETCYHKTQDSLYETESGQNMIAFKAYREGPGGTGSLYILYIEGLRRQDGRKICRLLS